MCEPGYSEDFADLSGFFFWLFYLDTWFWVLFWFGLKFLNLDDDDVLSPFPMWMVS